MGFFYGFDMTYLVFIVPCIIITLICQVKVKTTFSKYSQIRNSRNMTGAQAAEYVLRQHGVTGVRIEHVAGSMTDHFDPRTNVIRLSDTVFNSTSVAVMSLDGGQLMYVILCRKFSEKSAERIINITAVIILFPLTVLGFMVLLNSKYNFSLLFVCAYLIASLLCKNNRYY